MGTLCMSFKTIFRDLRCAMDMMHDSVSVPLSLRDERFFALISSNLSASDHGGFWVINLLD